jgi:hypothetical protein
MDTVLPAATHASLLRCGSARLHSASCSSHQNRFDFGGSSSSGFGRSILVSKESTTLVFGMPSRASPWGTRWHLASCSVPPRPLQLISTSSSKCTCAYLDDWLLWDVCPHQVQPILQELQRLGLTLNLQKSCLQPTTSLTYLGLQIDTVARTITPTRACVRHLRDLLTIVPDASPQDLRRMARVGHGLASVHVGPDMRALYILAAGARCSAPLPSAQIHAPAVNHCPSIYGRHTYFHCCHYHRSS